jgi:ArsR family transcriptional regulator, arsenate/arsenite/antimonite-responsive transcriptional repressor
MKKADQPERINRMFRAFSDPTRLRLLRLLLGGEMCVGDLVAVLRAPQPTVSRHLSYLRNAGLVGSRKQGLWSFYTLTPAEGAFHASLLNCLETCFALVPDMQADARRAQKVRERGGCCPGDASPGDAEKGRRRQPGSCSEEHYSSRSPSG